MLVVRKNSTGAIESCSTETGGWQGGQPHDEWLAMLSHELRSPLATILYALEVIAGGDELDPASRRARAVAERQARRTVQLVDDLFDLCAGSLGSLTIRKQVVDLAEVVAAGTEAAQPHMAAKGHRLTVVLPSQAVTLYADPLRLEQVLTNLLTNAAKFTEPGGEIRVTARVEADHVLLCVRDNGRGIARDQLPRVFELFHQGWEPGEVRAPGLGLGLALVKSVVERHNGTVKAFSDGPGAGSEFTVSLPARGQET